MDVEHVPSLNRTRQSMINLNQFQQPHVSYNEDGDSFTFHNEMKIPTTCIPEQFRLIFPFKFFNKMQSKSFHNIFQTNDNCVISSPTGSGKTVLFELAIIKLLNDAKNNLNSKIIYMAPTKALCKEKYDDWCSKFKHFKVGMLTSDTSILEMNAVKSCHLIICTPEKWDIITRRWHDYSKLLDYVSLLLIDEVHFLREDRGTSLEVVITRMKSLTLNLRIIALSATVPNIVDISNWLSNDNNVTNNAQIHTMVYNNDYRSVQLKEHVYGYKTARTKNPFKFDLYLNSKIGEVIKDHSNNKPTLIFCPTRSSCLQTAKYLSESMSKIYVDNLNLPKDFNIEQKKLIEHGICYHHAGLSQIQRKFIETLFINGTIKILCSTSTLAVGVNLPAYLVIIKGTQLWTKDGIKEYNKLDILQMMGRAGRPQFEKEGAAVIMTDYTMRDKYLKLSKGTQHLESTLNKNIYEHIAAEIILKTIYSLESAISWLKSTFLFQRFKKNPLYYSNINSKLTKNNNIEMQLENFINDIINELIIEKIIEIKEDRYVSTKFGEAMVKNYVQFETIKRLINSKEKNNLQDSLKLICQSKEFDHFKIKFKEKKLFQTINESPLILYPIKDKNIIEAEYKISLMIQFDLGGLEYPTFNGSMKCHYDFLTDKIQVFRNIQRILKAAIDVYVERKDAITLLNMMKLLRCIYATAWEHTSFVLKQFDGIGAVFSKRLMMHGIKNLNDAKNKLTREKLEFFIGLSPGSGFKMMKSIKSLPMLDLKISDVLIKGNKVNFKVKVILESNAKEISTKWNGFESFVSVVCTIGSKVLNFRRLPLRKMEGIKSFNLETTLEFNDDFIKVYLQVDEIAGLCKCLEIEQVRFFVKDLPERSIAYDTIDDVFSDDPGEQQQQQQQQQTESSTSMMSIIECNHKCPDKNSCRHYCCKNGILKRSSKKCKHSCKDKSKCRHMCCRDQFAYENSNQSTLEDIIHIQTNRFYGPNGESTGLLANNRIDSEIEKENKDPKIKKHQVILDSSEDDIIEIFSDNKSKITTKNKQIIDDTIEEIWSDEVEYANVKTKGFEDVPLFAQSVVKRAPVNNQLNEYGLENNLELITGKHKIELELGKCKSTNKLRKIVANIKTSASNFLDWSDEDKDESLNHALNRILNEATGSASITFENAPVAHVTGAPTEFAETTKNASKEEQDGNEDDDYNDDRDKDKDKDRDRELLAFLGSDCDIE